MNINFSIPVSLDCLKQMASENDLSSLSSGVLLERGASPTYAFFFSPYVGSLLYSFLGGNVKRLYRDGTLLIAEDEEGTFHTLSHYQCSSAIMDEMFEVLAEDPVPNPYTPSLKPYPATPKKEEEKAASPSQKRRLKVFPYLMGSASARTIAEVLECKRLRRSGSIYSGDAVIINWGSSAFPEGVEWGDNLCLNEPSAVKVATHKLKAFKKMEGVVKIPPFTTDKEEAKGWIGQGHAVVCRKLARANSARGLVIADKVEEVVDAVFYTKYIKKKNEYRVHIFENGETFVQRKALSSSFPKDEANWRVRNHDNGFIFQQNDFQTPEAVLVQARLALQVLELDFAAFDIIYNSDQQEAYVLEANTAPGLEGSTVEFYKKQLLNAVEKMEVK